MTITKLAKLTNSSPLFELLKQAFEQTNSFLLDLMKCFQFSTYTDQVVPVLRPFPCSVVEESDRSDVLIRGGRAKSPQKATTSNRPRKDSRCEITLLDIKNTNLSITALTPLYKESNHRILLQPQHEKRTKNTMTKFRPCIDLHAGSVKQIVGGTLTTTTSELKTNFTSELPSSYYANLYKENALEGAHVIMLGPGNENACREACEAWPGHLQVGGGIKDENAKEWIEMGASKVSFL
jgi:hypothetical protein